MKLLALSIIISVLSACSLGAQSIPSPADPASAPTVGTKGAGGGGW